MSKHKEAKSADASAPVIQASELALHFLELLEDKQRYLMPEGINARVSRYYICWHN